MYGTKYVGAREFMESLRRQKKNKYNARKVTINGRTFDSQREAAKAQEYLLLLRTGKISKLEYQPAFELTPRPNRITYKADFRITYPDGRVEIIDVKGFETPVFKMKKKLFHHFYPQLQLKIVQ